MTTGEKFFLFNWALSTLLVFAIALAMTGRLSVGESTPEIAGVITGLTMGVAQWLVLRQRAAWAPEWIAATAIGFFVSLKNLPTIRTCIAAPLPYNIEIVAPLIPRTIGERTIDLEIAKRRGELDRKTKRKEATEQSL